MNGPDLFVAARDGNRYVCQRTDEPERRIVVALLFIRQRSQHFVIDGDGRIDTCRPGVTDLRQCPVAVERVDVGEAEVGTAESTFALLGDPLAIPVRIRTAMLSAQQATVEIAPVALGR